jgi:hypothetical protein
LPLISPINQTSFKEDAMKKVILVIVVLLFAVSFAFAAGPKSYQVTGPVLEVKDDVIVVQKGNDKWEIAKDKS